MRTLSRLILAMIPRRVLAEVVDAAVAQELSRIERRCEVAGFRISQAERQLGEIQRVLFRRASAAVDDATFGDGAPEGALAGVTSVTRDLVGALPAFIGAMGRR